MTAHAMLRELAWRNALSRIVISGTSGDLGRRVTDGLLGSDASRQLTLVLRSPDTISVNGPNVDVRERAYERRHLLADAYEGGDQTDSGKSRLIPLTRFAGQQRRRSRVVAIRCSRTLTA